MTKTVKQTLSELRQNGETSSFDPDGVEWRSVYLDNARLPGVSPTQFRSHLAVLSKQGLYQPIDGWAWGDVRMTDLEVLDDAED